MACFLSLYPLLLKFINIIYNLFLLERHARDCFLFGSWPTCIILPLKDEHKGNERSSLAAGFHDVHPSLLLFLHRLKGIFIYDEVGDEFVCELYEIVSLFYLPKKLVGSTNLINLSSVSMG